MAKRYIAVDAGKYAVKSASYDLKTEKTKRFTFCTKISPGDFRDDALERNTFLMEINGEVYKIGNGAKGNGAALETSKQSQIHKNCILFAIANFCSAKEVDEVNIAVGLPAKEWAVVQKREDFKEFLFNEGEYHIKTKMSSAGEIEEKKFKIVHRYVFPESIGALFQDDSPEVNNSSFYGVLDIGNVNLNATVWRGVELQQDISTTDELGAASLIQGLSQELSAEFSRCDEYMVTQLLAKDPEFRYLKPNNGSEEVMARSKELIADFLMDHAKKIKRACDGRKWSLDYMTLVAIGGTSIILKDELKAVFGANLAILSNQTFANAYGFLRMMCAKEPEIKKRIALDVDE